MPGSRPSTASRAGRDPKTTPFKAAENPGKAAAQTDVGTPTPDGEVELPVRVALRIRPQLAKERMQKARDCIAISDAPNRPNTVVLGKDRKFTFDYVYGHDSTQESIHTEATASLVESCFNGYNATVLAYGQTGSGKTYTMGSGNNTQALEHEVGIIPRVIRQLFDGVEDRRDSAQCLVCCQFLEIYNEEVKDLLHPEIPSKAIAIREGAAGEIFVAGAKAEIVRDVDEMLRLLDRGSVCRATGGTLMNNQSSRSHAIFTILVEQRLLHPSSGQQEYVMAKFHLVDLAGSERNKKTGAIGQRFKESVNINSGLLALGNVISALGDERKRGSHVPYRESKLTRMLQDSLGGNSTTLMIACVSSADGNLEETLNTLKYANRARNIKNKPTQNRDVQSNQLAQMKSELQALKLQLMKHGLSTEGVNIPEGVGDEEATRLFLDELKAKAADADMGEAAALRGRVTSLDSELSSMRHELGAARLQVVSLQDEALKLRSERDHTQHLLDQQVVKLGSMLAAMGVMEAAGDMTARARARLLDIAGAAVGGGSRERVDAGAGAARPSTADAAAAPPPVGSRGEGRPGTAGPARPAADGAARASAGGQSPVPGSERALLEQSIRSQAGDEEAVSVIESHLRTIRGLEATLGGKEELLKAREAALGEAQDDLARDEMIFSEKVREIKDLKKAVDELKEERAESAAQHEAMVARLQRDLAAARAEADALRGGAGDGGAKGSAGVAVAAAGEEGTLHVDDDDEVVFGGDEDSIEIMGGDDGDDGSGGGALELAEALDSTRDFKAALEEKRRAAEEALQEQRRQFQARSSAMTQQLRDLEYNISEKEELIADLSKNELEAKLLSQQYESRMRELEAEVESREGEVERLKLDLHEIDTNIQKSEAEKRTMRSQYEDKVKRVQSQLIALKRQQKEQESARVEKVRLQSEAKVNSLQAEIERMREQQAALRKKSREAEAKHDSEADERAAAVTALRKEAEAGAKRIRELEEENKRQATVLRRRAVEVASAQKKLRDLGGGASAPGAGGGAAGAGGQRTPAKRAAAPARGEGGGGAGEPDKYTVWLDKEIEKLLRKKEAEESLAHTTAKRTEVLIEKEEAAARRSALDLKRQRTAKALRAEADELSQAVDELEAEVEALHPAARRGEEKAAREILALEEQKSGTYRRRAEVEERLRAGLILPPEEEECLRDLEDRVDALETEAEYLATQAAEAESTMADAQEASDMFRRRSDKMNLPEAKQIIQGYVARIVAARDRERQDSARVCEFELQLAEYKHEAEAAEASRRRLEMEYDRRVNELQREHARKVKMLLKQASVVSSSQAGHPLGPGGAAALEEGGGGGEGGGGSMAEVLKFKNEQISMMDKDNFYYKQTNRELKRRLREVMMAHETEAGERERVQESLHMERSELHALNSSLMSELSNYKAMARRAGVAVRVSRADLRAVDGAEIRKSLAVGEKGEKGGRGGRGDSPEPPSTAPAGGRRR